MTAIRSRFSPRRKALLVAMLALVAAMLVLRFLGIAGFNGTQPREMDWNGDGVADQAEIVQGFTIVAVETVHEGPRSCRRYARLRDPDALLRVDCRVEVAGDAAGNERP
ncbi:MAG: EF-hand domain-containing protein [Luteimonas sp.]|nr:EF-hand domain-containing protein [Luteimonas sp.]